MQLGINTQDQTLPIDYSSVTSVLEQKTLLLCIHLRLQRSLKMTMTILVVFDL